MVTELCSTHGLRIVRHNDKSIYIESDCREDILFVHEVIQLLHSFCLTADQSPTESRASL